MPEKTNYVGKGWSSNPKFINLELNQEAVSQLPKNDYGMIKITVALMNKPDGKSKATHTVFENTYQKNENKKDDFDLE